MDIQNMTKEDLLNQLIELQHDYDLLKTSYEKDIAKSKQNEIDLQISEEQKRVILNGIKSNIAFVDKDLKIIWANKTAAESVNKCPEEMVGKSCHQFWADPKKPCENCPSIKAFTSKQSEQIIMHTPDGKIWEERGEPILDIEGNVIGVVEIATDITESKKVEYAIRESEEKYRLLHENAGIGIGYYKVDGTIILYNNIAAKNMNGVPEDFNGKSIYAIFPKPIAEFYHERIKKAAESEIPEVYEDEVSLPTVNKYFLSTYTRITNFNDEIVGVQILSQDITDRKQAENEILKIGQHYQALIDKAPDGIVLIDAEGKFKYISPAAKKIFGYTQTDEVPGNPAEYTHPDDLEMVFSELGKIFGDPTYVPTLEYRFIDKQGDWHWVETTFTNMIANPNVESIVLNFRDITERKKVEYAIRESEEKLKAIIETSPDGIAITSLEGTIQFVTTKVLSMWGYNSEEEILGRNTMEFLHPDYHQKAISLISEMINGNLTGAAEYLMVRKDGSTFYCEANANILRDVNNNPIGILYIKRDISERKKAEEKTKASEERYVQLLNNLEAGIVVHAKDTSIIMNNPRATELLGLTNDQMIGKVAIDPAWRFVNEDHSPLSIDEYPINKIVKTKTLIKNRILGIQQHFNNEITWVTVNGFPVLDNKGEIVEIVISFIDITDRKLSEAMFKDIVEKNPMSIQILNLEGYPIMENQAHTNLFGVKPPSSYSVLKDPLLLENGFGEIFERIKNGEAVYLPDLYYNVHDIDPSYPNFPVWVRTLGFSLNDNSGNPDKIVFMHENITERKNAETVLNDIIDNNPMSIQIVDIEGITLQFNSAFIELFGAAPPPGFSIFDDLKSKNPELESLISLVKNGETIHLPDIYFNAHDTLKEAPDMPLWIRALIFPLNRGMGRSERFVFMHENISKSKIAEQELIKAKEKAEENEKQFRLLYENSPLGTYIALPEGNIISVNNTALKMLGSPSEEATKQINILHFPPLIENGYTEKFLECIQTGKTIALSIRYKSKWGKLNYLSSYLIPLKNINGKVEKVYTIMQDITEQKQAEEDLILAKEKAEESDRLKSAFLANMSHEIRTPMNGILGFAGLLKEPNLSGEEQQDYIKIIEQSGTRMLNIINDIVDISKIEAGLMKLDIRETNINEQIEYIYTFFKPEVEAKGLNLSFDNQLTAKDATIRTDREKVYAILTNLVKNAIKYTPSGSIEFGYVLKKGSQTNAIELSKNVELHFFVKDTGVGVPMNRQQAIFERFIQSDIEDTMAQQGAGLGLAITKAYVEMLGGRIWVDSQEGQGSTFWFTLPYNVELAEKFDAHKFESSMDTNPVRKFKILITEDDEISALLLGKNLKNLGSELLTATTGIEAVDLCRQNPDIDLILMDVRMPQMNGYDAVREIRKFNKEVVIIAQTAFGLSGEREKAIAAGCNDYLAKPIEREELLDLIKKYFE